MVHGRVHDEDDGAVYHEVLVAHEPVHRSAHRMVVVVHVSRDRDPTDLPRHRKDEGKADCDLATDMLDAPLGRASLPRPA